MEWKNAERTPDPRILIRRSQCGCLVRREGIGAIAYFAYAPPGTMRVAGIEARTVAALADMGHRVSPGWHISHKEREFLGMHETAEEAMGACEAWTRTRRSPGEEAK